MLAGAGRPAVRPTDRGGGNVTHRTIRDWFAVAGTALALTLPMPASALVLVGGQGQAVTVDPSALDAASSRRLDVSSEPGGLLMPGQRVAPGARVMLVPPGQKSQGKITLTPPGAKTGALRLPGAERVVLTPPGGAKPLLTPPKRTAAVAPVKRAPSAAEIEAEVSAKAAPAPKPAPQAAAPTPIVTPPPAPVEPPAPPAPVVEAPAAPTPIAPAEPLAVAPPAVPEPPPMAAAPEPQRLAAVTPPAAPTVPAAPAIPQAATPVATVALAFEAEDARLNETHRALLKDVVARLSNEPEANVQLLAYAQGENRSKARRLSLSRALAVRSYLLSQDVRNTRIEVRALGDQPPATGRPDRVDVVIEKP